LSWSVQVLP